jgi:7-carboxy-7-deazaguanine synthase
MIDTLKNALTEEQQALLDVGKILPIMEQFYTIQGEGFYTGHAAYFIRVGGCDVGCHWCDVKESWNPLLHPLTDVNLVINEMKNHPAKTIVVTGGEPSSYNMDFITKEIHNAGFNAHIETSGAYELGGTWEWICLSPKKTMPPKTSIYNKAHELKVIVFNQNDFKWAEEHATKVNAACKLFLQPEWSKRNELMPQIVDYVMQNPKWQISLQTHKYLNIP